MADVGGEARLGLAGFLGVLKGDFELAIGVAQPLLIFLQLLGHQHQLGAAGAGFVHLLGGVILEVLADPELIDEVAPQQAHERQLAGGDGQHQRQIGPWREGDQQQAVDQQASSIQGGGSKMTAMIKLAGMR